MPVVFVEPRSAAVLEVAQQRMADVARRYGSGARACTGGFGPTRLWPGGLADRSSRPLSCPRQMAPRSRWIVAIHREWHGAACLRGRGPTSTLPGPATSASPTCLRCVCSCHDRWDTPMEQRRLLRLLAHGVHQEGQVHRRGPQLLSPPKTHHHSHVLGAWRESEQVKLRTNPSRSVL